MRISDWSSDVCSSDLLQTVLAGETPDMDANQWSAYTSTRLAALVSVAETALDSAKEYAALKRGAMQRSLALQLVLLAAACGFAAARIVAINRRVIGPLHRSEERRVGKGCVSTW